MTNGERLYDIFAQEVTPLGFLPWAELPEHVQSAWQHIYGLAVVLSAVGVVVAESANTTVKLTP
jgi:hypothetical protein